MGVIKQVLNSAPAGARKPRRGQTVTVHCTGYGKDRDLSKKFWSTKDPGQNRNAPSGLSPVYQATHLRTDGVHYRGSAGKEPAVLKQPFSYNIGLGQVIKGWDEGVMEMGIGEVARLTCTPDYAYGAHGFPSWGIMPDSTLIFEIEVLSID